MRFSLRDISYNLAGLVVPPALALLIIPRLLERLGQEKFGLLSLAWALTVVSGLFDLGVGRAATLVISRYLGALEPIRAALAARAAVRLSAITGGIGLAVFSLGIVVGAMSLLEHSAALRAEVTGSAWLLALTIPFQVGMAGFRGIAEANQRFKEISLVRMALGAANFGLPWLISLLSTDLRYLVGSILFSRIVGWFWLKRVARVGNEHTDLAVFQEMLSELIHAGGWFTVSSIVNPILVQSDRFFIASLLTVAAVPTFSIPSELTLQLLVISSAVASVVFPNLSAEVVRNPERARQGVRKLLEINGALMAVVTITIALIVPYFLPWWSDGRLGPEAVKVSQILCVGVWFNSQGMMCMSYLHAKKRYRATALSHVCQLVVYVPFLIFAIHRWGIIGAAAAWMARVLTDTLFLMGLTWWRNFEPPNTGTHYA